ncbi:uncharacterized protein EURHEDRAFT_380360 [Aspergillus ruber CBS 135680]|uniref:Zn(2)-C6 fungal-type domain-containing protein n=1 Tax=Aspergillus ruber (strain CBS 135680) TaxID=1388766 RepID=A0A017S5Y9_ASPRC|nr:uncharacterized protein EURHEDRAFT_380360 [Aspergillus ruber CBS 135680]EYE92276.1 hypothetical protein EURHEDRAFT_380360 [Aspergillus ruber CBS 135680]
MADFTPRKRRRPALSCVQCRQRKVRCDRAFPCGPCTRARHSIPCSYSFSSQEGIESAQSSSRIARVASGHSEDGSDFQPVCQAARQSLPLEQMVQDLQDRVWRLEQVVSLNRESECFTRDGGLSQSLYELSNRVSNIEQQMTRSIAGLGPQDTCIPAPTLRLKTTPEKTKVASQGHWTNAFHQLRMLEKIDDIQAAEMREEIKKCKGIRATLKHKSIMWDEPFQHLNLDINWEVVEYTEMAVVYFRTLGPIYRILNSSFLEDYNKRLVVRTEPAPHSFILKALLVIGIGSVFHPDKALQNDIHLRVHRWVYAAQWWLTGPDEKSAHSIDGLQVYCLMLLCRQVHSLNKGSIWVSAGSLVRFACSLGLHRDPSHFLSLSPYECETRRMLWAAVMEIAVQASFDIPMPPLISEDDFDTEPPINIDESQLDKNTRSVPSAEPYNQYTDASIQRLLLKSLPTRLQVARFSNQIGQPQCYEQALKLGTELTAFCAEFAKYFQSHNLSESAEFHQKVLSTFIRRTIILLYRPFLLQSPQDSRFYLARKLSFESAMVIASYADTTDIASKPLDYYTKLSISGVGAFKGPFSIDTIIVICCELVTQLEEEAKTRPRLPDGKLSVPDNVLHRMAQASRRPIIEVLEHIQEQLLQVIGLGVPSMKRCAILSTVMGQIKAMERTGRYTKDDVYRALVEYIKKCAGILERYIEEIGSGISGSVDEWTPVMSDIDVESLLKEFGFPWDDIPLGFPGVQSWTESQP